MPLLYSLHFLNLSQSLLTPQAKKCGLGSGLCTHGCPLACLWGALLVLQPPADQICLCSRQGSLGWRPMPLYRGGDGEGSAWHYRDAGEASRQRRAGTQLCWLLSFQSWEVKVDLYREYILCGNLYAECMYAYVCSFPLSFLPCTYINTVMLFYTHVLQSALYWQVLHLQT